MFGLFSKKSQTIPLWFKTDIHCHILPGIDDGSADIDESLEIIDGLAQMGIERIYASPHIAAIEFPNNSNTIQPAYETLQKTLSEKNIDINVGYSAEYRIDEELPDLIEARNLIPYPGNYILIENQWIQEPWNLEQVIFDLQIKGYQPIMAHPERFVYYHKNMDRLDQLHLKVPFQINMLSLAGYYGKNIKNVAETLLKKGYADFLGTDVHHPRHIECLKNYLRTSQAVKHREMSIKTVKNDKFIKPESK